jgi:hypothetical protein
MKTTIQRDIIVEATENQDELIAKYGEELALAEGLEYVSGKIIGGFPVGSWWEHSKGIVVEFVLEDR